MWSEEVVCWSVGTARMDLFRFDLLCSSWWGGDMLFLQRCASGGKERWKMLFRIKTADETEDRCMSDCM